MGSSPVKDTINVVTVVLNDNAYENAAPDLDEAWGGTWNANLVNQRGHAERVETHVEHYFWFAFLTRAMTSSRYPWIHWLTGTHSLLFTW
jgi:hypothetical protein